MLMTISDERKILEKAHRLLIASGVKSFPLKMKPVITYLQTGNDIHVLKYSTAANGMNIPAAATGTMVGSDEAALVYQGPDKPACIYYKSAGIPKERIRWNLGHEVAHFCCGHHLVQYHLKQEGLEMSPAAAARFEAEANAFVRAMHAPLELVIAFMRFYGLCDKVGVFSILRCIFRLSVPAAYYYTGQILSKRTRQLIMPENVTCFDEFYREITGTYDQRAFGSVVYRYQREYDMFKTDQDRRESPFYRTPYAETMTQIMDRVIPEILG